MSRNAALIKSALQGLSGNTCQIVNGTVVAGSLDTSAYTIDVQTAGTDEIVCGVRLNALTGSNQGLLLYPKDGSEVTIGTIDGPGEWILLRASELEQMTVVKDGLTIKLDATAIKLQNSSVTIEIGSSLMTLKNSSESLYQLLKDLLTYIQALTVTTGTGPSGPPVNIADFVALSTRVDNLLSA